MIKAKATGGEGQPIIVIGLSRMNTTLLHQGKPITFDLAEIGMVGRVVIFAGETERAMAAQLREFVTEDTVVTDRTREPS